MNHGPLRWEGVTAGRIGSIPAYGIGNRTIGPSRDAIGLSTTFVPSAERTMDGALLERAKGGDRDAYSAVAFELSDRLFATAHRILRDFDAAGDALQTTLLQMWRDLPSLRDPERLEAWAFRILVRACQDQLRISRRRAARLQLLREDRVVEDASANVADREQLNRAFGRLPVDQRAALVLQYYRGLTVTEIAGILQVPTGTVRSRIHYAKQALRSAIEADERTMVEIQSR